MEHMKNITFYRERAGLSITGLAKRAGITQPAMSMIEKHKSTTVGTLIKLCEALECSPNEMLGWESITEPKIRKKYLNAIKTLNGLLEDNDDQ